MRYMTAVKLTIVFSDSHFRSKLNIIELESALEIRIIEPISVVARNNVGVVALNKFAEFQQSVFF